MSDIPIRSHTHAFNATPKLGANLKDTSQKLLGFKTYLSFNCIDSQGLEPTGVFPVTVFFAHLTFNPRYIAFASGYQAIHKAQAFLLQFRTSRKSIPVGKKKPSRIVANLLWNLLQFGQSFSCWYLLPNSSDIDSPWPWPAPVHLRDRNSIRSLRKCFMWNFCKCILPAVGEKVMFQKR